MEHFPLSIFFPTQRMCLFILAQLSSLTPIPTKYFKTRCTRYVKCNQPWHKEVYSIHNSKINDQSHADIIINTYMNRPYQHKPIMVVIRILISHFLLHRPWRVKRGRKSSRMIYVYNNYYWFDVRSLIAVRVVYVLACIVLYNTPPNTFLIFNSGFTFFLVMNIQVNGF